MSKQMRVPDAQYNLLLQLETVFGTSRTDIITNMIKLAKIIADNDVVRLKLINENGEEKEFVMTLTKVKTDSEE